MRMKSFMTLLCLFLIIMVDGYDLQSMGFVAPEIARSWGVSLAAFGPAFAAGLAGTIPGAMLAGPFSRAVGRRSLLAFSLVLFGGGTLAAAHAGSLTALTLIRFVVGAGLGAAIPLVMSIAAENVVARRRATFVTIVLCGQPIGAIAGAALCARLIPAFGWQSAFWLGGVLPLLLVPGVLALPITTAVAADETTQSALAGAAPARRAMGLWGPELRSSTLLLSATAFFAIFLLYVIVNWLPGIMREEGYSLDESLLAIGLFNSGGIVGAVLVGILIDRFGPLRVVAPAYLLAALSIAALAFARDTLSLLLAAALLSGLAAYGCGVCLGSLTILLYPPALHASSAGWVLGVGRLGAALGPLGIGFALSIGLAPSHTFYFASVAAVLAAVCLLILARVRAGLALRASPAHGVGAGEP